ncbi:MAG: hypothetical protein HY716_14150 [Planctomycetes bacterium]|nr:hypothetical protein [Planctomycetota bacterium]
MELECEACRTPLTLDEPGAYECPRCQSLFRYEGGSRVVFLPPPEASPIRLSLGFSEEATEGLLGFVRAVVRRAGFSETEASSFEAAVKEVVQAIRRIAYDGRDNQVYHVLIVRSGSEVELHFADSGSRMVSDENGEDRRTRFAAARAFMDRFEIKAAARGGNVVTLTKKMKSG